MKGQTEQEFYDRLNEIDEQDDDKRSRLRETVCLLISGGVVGFIFGYFLGATVWKGVIQ